MLYRLAWLFSSSIAFSRRRATLACSSSQSRAPGWAGFGGTPPSTSVVPCPPCCGGAPGGWCTICPLPWRVALAVAVSGTCGSSSPCRWTHGIALVSGGCCPPPWSTPWVAPVGCACCPVAVTGGDGPLVSGLCVPGLNWVLSPSACASGSPAFILTVSCFICGLFWLLFDVTFPAVLLPVLAGHDGVLVPLGPVVGEI